MKDTTLNKDWAAIGKLCPRIHSHIEISPQLFRGNRWYVVRDMINSRFLRVNATTYEFIGRLDGRHSVEEIYTYLGSKSANEVINQDEITLLINQLYSLDLLRDDNSTATPEIVEKIARTKAAETQRKFLNPLAIRIALIDPDRFLHALAPWIRPVFCKPIFILWLLVVAFACVLLIGNASTLSASISTDIITTNNLFLMTLLFIVIKTIHEMAHAFAVKIWGGEVHEMGITLLVFAPVPYVDASAAWDFKNKHKRIIVSAIGIMVELLLAAIALFVWLLVEPGLVQDIAFNTMLIGSVSTLLFNANPLLRFDGYYVLQDAIEIPNLYTRSSRYYQYLVQRYLYGLNLVVSPSTARGEAIWFALYGLAAFIYRISILVVIVLFLAKEFLFVGVAIAAWAIFMQIVLPIGKAFKYLLNSPMLQGYRFRAISTSALLLTLMTSALLLIPVSHTTTTEGVVWISEQAQHYAQADGFVTDIHVKSGSYVEAGAPILQMRATELEAEIQKLKAKHREQTLRAAAEFVDTGGKSKLNKVGLRIIESELDLLETKFQSLHVKSKLEGIFILPDEARTKGRYFRQGEIIGYIFNPNDLIVKAVVPQSDIGLLHKNVERIEVRLADRINKAINVDLVRETPSGTTTLPSSALGTAGGGDIAVRKTDDQGTTAAEEVFKLELALPENVEISRLGGRAYVRIDHGSMPLATQWAHSGRQLLLGRLSM